MTGEKQISRATIDEFKAGDSFVLETKILREMVDGFAEVSGDTSTLHMDADFARNRGYSGRVVHGVLLMGFLSKIVGVNFPGENALLQSIESRFCSPTYIDDSVRIEVIVDHVSVATNCLVLKAKMTNRATRQLLMKSKMQVGFTRDNV